MLRTNKWVHKLKKTPQNCRPKMADTKEVSSWRPKNIKRHRTKFSRPAFVYLCAIRPLPGKLLLYCLAQKVQRSTLSAPLERHLWNVAMQWNRRVKKVYILCTGNITVCFNPVYCNWLHLSFDLTEFKKFHLLFVRKLTVLPCASLVWQKRPFRRTFTSPQVANCLQIYFRPLRYSTYGSG